MGQRGIWNISISGVKYYWRNFYFVNARNYNWFFQDKFLNIFCNYFFIWVMYLNKFFIKFLNLSVKKIFLLNYYYYFYKLREERLNFMNIWFLKNIIFRNNAWIIIYIEYYCLRKYGYKTIKILKKMRHLVDMGSEIEEDEVGDASKLNTV